MTFAEKFLAVLPGQDLNGDTISAVTREDFYRVTWPIIEPVRGMFVKRLRSDPDKVVADLETPGGRAAFLDAWWPPKSDGACIAWTAARRMATDVPYPPSMLRSVGVVYRIDDETILSGIRFGNLTPTTTRNRALWDAGVRRQVWHLTVGFHAWLVEQKATARLVPMDRDDPNRTWAYMPGAAVVHERAYYLVMRDRPETDDAMEWMRGAK